MSRRAWLSARRRAIDDHPFRLRNRHASKWREWRLFQLLYVWEKKADLYVPILTNDSVSNDKS